MDQVKTNINLLLSPKFEEICLHENSQYLRFAKMSVQKCISKVSTNKLTVTPVEHCSSKYSPSTPGTQSYTCNKKKTNEALQVESQYATGRKL